VLAAAGLALVIFAVCVWRRTAFTAAQAPLMALNCVYTRVIWRMRYNRRLPVPRGQGAVIVCNHRCPLDPAFIGLTVDRIVHWMVAREYCENPLLGWFFRACRSIPVGRGGIDTAATKQAIRWAREGGRVGVFPEGRINETDQLMLSGRPGAALIALKARVPVVPCYIHGSPYGGAVWDCLLTPAKVTLTIGPPIDLSEYYGRENEREVLEGLTRRFMRQIATLAGHPEFEPQLAGRFYKPGLADQ